MTLSEQELQRVLADPARALIEEICRRRNMALIEVRRDELERSLRIRARCTRCDQSFQFLVADQSLQSSYTTATAAIYQGLDDHRCTMRNASYGYDVVLREPLSPLSPLSIEALARQQERALREAIAQQQERALQGIFNQPQRRGLPPIKVAPPPELPPMPVPLAEHAAELIELDAGPRHVDEGPPTDDIAARFAAMDLD